MKVSRNRKFLGLIGGAALVFALDAAAGVSSLARINGFFLLLDNIRGEDNSAVVEIFSDRCDIEGEVEFGELGEPGGFQLVYDMNAPNYCIADQQAGQAIQYTRVGISVNFWRPEVEVEPKGEVGTAGGGEIVSFTGIVDTCNLYYKVYPNPNLNGDNGIIEAGGQTATIKGGGDAVGTVQLVCLNALSELGADSEVIGEIVSEIVDQGLSDIRVDANGTIFVVLQDTLFEDIIAR